SVVMTPRKRAMKSAAKAMPVRYERMTFRRGFVMSARFLDANSVIYGAAWEDRPLEIFTSSRQSPESLPLGINGDVLAVSSHAELAVSLGRRYLGGFASSGTIARMALGGAPRVLCEHAQDADWSPDGKSLLIVRQVGGMHRIEWPIGTVLYETPTWLSHARISPRGDHIAFLEHPVWGDDAGSAAVIDRSGKVVMRSPERWNTTGGLVWHPKGDEIWVAGAKHGADRDIYALTVSGKERSVLAFPGRVCVHDIDAKGSLLISSDSGRREIVAGRRGEPGRNLSWFDWSWLAGLTVDGCSVLLEEQGAATRGVNAIYMRDLDGSPAVRLAEGRARGMPLSPDGKWILALSEEENCLQLLPVGIGEPRAVACPGMQTLLWWQFFPDGQRALVLANRVDQPKRMYEIWLDGSHAPREISPAA